MAAPRDSKATPPEAQDVLVVVFDSGKARFFTHHPNGRLESLKTWESGLHRNNTDTVSDKPGRSVSSVGQGRSAIEPKHDPHKMEKHNFVHALVAELDTAFDQGKFKRLVVVAPERSLGEFRKEASAKLMRTVWREVPKDLVHFSESDLQERLAPHFKPEIETATPPR